MVAAPSYGAAPEASAAPGSVERQRSTVLACFLCLVVVAEGYDFGVLNGAAVRLKDDLKCSAWEVSLIVTATPLFLMTGALAGGAAADALGRRTTLLVCCALLVAGPLAMAFAPSVPLLVIARAVVGFAIGIGFVAVSMYLAEVTPADMRGKLTSLEDIFMNIGMLQGYLINWLLLGIENDWRYMLGLGSVLPFFVFIATLSPQVPESPRWLFMRGREEEAERVLVSFVGPEEAQQTLAAMRAEAKGAAEEFVTWQNVLCESQPPELRQMLRAGCACGVASTLCGFTVILYYSSTVLAETMSEQAAFLVTAIMGGARLSSLLALYLVEDVGRRPLLLASALVCCAAVAWLTLAFSTHAGSVAQDTGFVCFMVGYGLGLGPVSWLYLAEVFDTRWRSKGMALSLTMSRTVGAATTLAFPLLVEGVGTAASFGVLVLMGALTVLLLWAFVPETHGTPLEGGTEKLFGDKDPS
mmetsp:Transcript_9514/g.29441  ORF Transcript_9514/g.29441 Transcript_9514/m.29441 type:complete len:470 (-) Transcript_9514:58-1467(-)